MRIAVIPGATRGIGPETARVLAGSGHHVVLTGRNGEAVQRGLDALADAGSIEGHALDVADDRSVDAFFAWLEDRHGRIDVLVNNAGRIYGAHSAAMANTDAATIAEAIHNNALGAWRMMRHAPPVMNRQRHGRIVNVSSGMGAVPYRVSKTALNALTILAAHEAGAGVKVNAVCPGWVRTEMGGPGANRDVGQGRAASSGRRRCRRTGRAAGSSAMELRSAGDTAVNRWGAEPGRRPRLGGCGTICAAARLRSPCPRPS
jgi:NAD(P)-dependent dehydrogenase (short-subunit alcohol dehydrogenase family)